MLDQLLVPASYSLAATFNLDKNEVDPKITVSGYSIPDPETMSDPDLQRLNELQTHARFLRSAIPPIDPLYRFRKDLIRDLKYWYEHGWDDVADVLLLFGPTGAGKTSLIEQWCARLGIPMLAVKGHRDFKEYEAFGAKDLVAGDTIFTPGPLTLAAQYGLPVIINEYDRIPAAKAIVFNDVFEGRAFPIPGNLSQVVVPQPGFRVIITGNTNLVEDPTGNYQTAASHDISLLERLFAIRVGYPDPKDEQVLLETVLAAYPDKLLLDWFDQEGMKVNTPVGLKEGSAISRGDFINGLLDVARKIRDQSKDGGSTSDAALERTMSTRILRKWVSHSVKHADAPAVLGLSALHYALKKCLSDLSTQSTKIALHEAVTTVFGVAETIS